MKASDLTDRRVQRIVKTSQDDQWEKGERTAAKRTGNTTPQPEDILSEFKSLQQDFNFTGSTSKKAQENILQEGVNAAGEAADQGMEQLEGLGQQIVDAAKENPELLAGILGAVGGGAVGGLASDENRLMKALIGSAVGGSAGVGSMAASRQLMGRRGTGVTDTESAEDGGSGLGRAALLAGGIGLGGYGGAKAFKGAKNVLNKLPRTRALKTTGEGAAEGFGA